MHIFLALIKYENQKGLCECVEIYNFRAIFYNERSLYDNILRVLKRVKIMAFLNDVLSRTTAPRWARGKVLDLARLNGLLTVLHKKNNGMAPSRLVIYYL